VVPRGSDEECNKNLVATPEGRRTFGTHKRRWGVKNNMYLNEIGWGINWIQLAQDRYQLQGSVSEARSSDVLKRAVNFPVYRESASCSRALLPAVYF
jgi:hypothetical protein